MPSDTSQLQWQLAHITLSKLEGAVAALRKQGRPAAAGGGKEEKAACDLVRIAQGAVEILGLVLQCCCKHVGQAADWTA